MPDTVTSSSSPVGQVFYQSSFRWVRAVMVGAVSIMLLIQAIGNIPEHPASAVMFGLLIVAAGALIYFDVWAMETRPEGLYIRYAFGNSRLIPYDQIRRLAVRGHRGGPVLRLYTLNGRQVAVIGLGYYSLSRPDRADDLIFAINQAAHLTKFSKSRLGWPTYDRET